MRQLAALFPRMFLLIALATAAPATAQDDATAAPEATIYSLAPAITPSPRDTIRVFLQSMQQVEAIWGQPDRDVELAALTRRLVDTLDLGATRNGGTYSEQARRVLLLDEILSRLTLPPLAAIPGPEEVENEQLTVWTIPGTRMQIVRIAEGARAGEWVFSANTVADLGIDYRRVKAIPYQPGQTGLLEEYLVSPKRAWQRDQRTARRAGSLDLGSPRATLGAFLENMNSVNALIQEARSGLAASLPSITVDEARAFEARAADFLRRAVETLDLSNVPEVEKYDRGVETALQLKEILDRILLPPIAAVPDEVMVAAARGEDVNANALSAVPFRWNIPRTSLAIAAILEGPHAGSFLFTTDSVAQIPDIYERMADLPYRQVAAGVGSTEYRSAQVSPGLYDYYVSTPGFLIAEATWLGRVTADLPAWLNERHYGQTRWQWIGVVVVVLVAVGGAILARRVMEHAAKGLNSPWRHWLRVLTPLLMAILLQGGIRVIDETLNFTGAALTSVRTAGGVVVIALAVWTVWRLFRAIAESFIASPRIADRGIDASLIRIGTGLLAFVSGLYILVEGLQGLGADLVPLLAGLGVGGLAGALAIRPTLENLIGGLILYTDKPVRVGDFCSFGGYTGTIQNIGIRSTHVRGLDRTVIAVPNAKLVDMEITNFARCDQMLINTSIGVRYETTPDQIRYLLAKMREMLHAHPMIDRDTVRVRFAGFGASSQDIMIRVYVLTHEWNDFFAVREDVMLRIADLVAASGTGFAFPSQTLYMARDDGLDRDRGQKAAAEVERWRRSGDLPFPRLRSSRMDELEGTLDYPPRGSNEARAKDIGRQVTEERLSADDGDAPEERTRREKEPKPA